MDRDHELEEIMGLRRIPRKDIFEEFMHFMLRKSFEEIFNDNEEKDDETLKVKKKNIILEPSKKLTSEDEEFGPKIKRKSTAILKEKGNSKS